MYKRQPNHCPIIPFKSATFRECLCNASSTGLGTVIHWKISQMCIRDSFSVAAHPYDPTSHRHKSHAPSAPDQKTAPKYGYIDDVIEPRNTRFRIIRALQQLQTKKLSNPAKKHGNIPL